jgi:glycosyltransferase involved in cell wall biosynthesis
LQKREIEKLGIKGKISIFPMGVDEVLLEAGRKREANLTGRNFTILSNRNLLPIYNVSLLIRAIPMVINEEPEVRFLIAGEGSERENLEREARSLNIEKAVQFIGRIPHKDMADLLGRIDIYISTSLYDGTSVSLLEAMAAGAFPIVTNIPANREWIVEGENGFLFPENNEKILAKNIIEAIQNRTLLEKSRDKNLSIVEKKALWSVCIRKIKDIYQAQLP